MGTYYYLLNDSKKERVSLESDVKRGAMTANKAVHYAIVNYMMCSRNMGDALRLVCDWDDCIEYAEVNLLTYDFDDEAVVPTIVSMLNDLYDVDCYAVSGKVGVRVGSS